MEIPIETVIDKMLTNRLISRKTVMVLAGIWGLITIIQAAPLETITNIYQCAYVVAQLSVVAVVVVSGVVTQARLDSQNGAIATNNKGEGG